MPGSSATIVAAKAVNIGAKILEFINKILIKVKKTIIFINGLITDIENFINGIIDKINAGFAIADEYIKGKIKFLTDKIQGVIDSIKKWYDKVVEGIKAWVNKILNKIKKTVLASAFTMLGMETNDEFLENFAKDMPPTADDVIGNAIPKFEFQVVIPEFNLLGTFEHITIPKIPMPEILNAIKIPVNGIEKKVTKNFLGEVVDSKDETQEDDILTEVTGEVEADDDYDDSDNLDDKFIKFEREVPNDRTSFSPEPNQLSPEQQDAINNYNKAFNEYYGLNGEERPGWITYHTFYQYYLMMYCNGDYEDPDKK